MKRRNQLIDKILFTRLRNRSTDKILFNCDLEIEFVSAILVFQSICYINALTEKRTLFIYLAIYSLT